MADTLAAGNLAAIIVARREAGDSWENLAQHLYATHGIVVTGITVADWHRQITADTGEASA